MSEKDDIIQKWMKSQEDTLLEAAKLFINLGHRIDKMAVKLDELDAAFNELVDNLSEEE